MESTPPFENPDMLRNRKFISHQKILYRTLEAVSNLCYPVRRIGGDWMRYFSKQLFQIDAEIFYHSLTAHQLAVYSYLSSTPVAGTLAK